MTLIRNWDEIEITGDALAEAIGVSRRRVHQLVNEGVLKKNENKKFLIENIRQYCEYLRSGMTETKADTQAEYWEKKTLHEDTRQEMAAIKLAKIKNEMHSAADVERVLTGMLAVFRSKILAIPSKVSLKLANKNSSDIRKTLSGELREALLELSEYDPAMFTAGDDDEDSTENT